MRVSVESATAIFSSLSQEEQALFLARLGHELTVDARDTYVPQSLAIHDPERLRAFNEIQHRTHGHLVALLMNCRERYPDAVLMGIILGHEQGKLKAQTSRAFEAANAKRLRA